MWPFSKAPKLYTGRTLTAAALSAQLCWPIGLTLGKASYAEVNSAAVIYLARKTRDDLWGSGVTKWSPNATCTLYASRFVSLANELFFNAAFQDPLSAQILALAAGEVWFHPDVALPGQDHAINVCMTERGPLTVDSQAPNQLRPLSATELLTRTKLAFL